MNTLLSNDNALIADIRELIERARQRTATAVNAELTRLYWQIGRRLWFEVIKGERAAYGQQIFSVLSANLTVEYGKGWSERQLRHCLRIAEVFPDEKILHTLCAELSWSHLRQIAALDDAIKRDFYIELCRLEHWSVRQLQERMNSMLYERSAISKKP
jgi:hypothetical protein